ncbi:uncharacterized protein [Dermacentor andersoni]|uniref:uncharacterized protein isoform X3 n=1 Tax=Dermacentor andersoni TaxID=34620 RepID=UPI003B3B3978
MSRPVLLSSFISSCAWRVRIVLEVKKIDFEYRAVDLKPNGEQQTAKFKTANPMGQVPVLLADGKPISQSVAIMEYLEEKYPEPRMLPADPYQRAKCREVVELLVSGVQPLQSIGLIPLLGRVEWKKWADRTITRGFADDSRRRKVSSLTAGVALSAGSASVGVRNLQRSPVSDVDARRRDADAQGWKTHRHLVVKSLDRWETALLSSDPEVQVRLVRMAEDATRAQGLLAAA